MRSIPINSLRWRRLIHEGALLVARSEEVLVPLSEVKNLKKQVRELQRLLGKKTMEVEILRDAL